MHMKKTALTLSAMIIGIYAYNQNWTFPGNPGTPESKLGTTNQFPMRVITQNALRMYINPNVTTSVNGQPALARNGFVGIGFNHGITNNNWNDVLGNPSGGPLSLLHLSGPEGTEMGTGGFRNWMRSGITFTANHDLMYVGPRANALDRTDAMFVWGDNSQTGEYGPDNLLFAFTAGFGTTGNDLDGTAPNGREIMRLTATGNVGIGPRFSNAAQPQSQLHITAST
jgi:hypothetical protein